ncbi:RIP homotypic interaction motif-containing protein [Kutzneria buriramensis]|uniref:RIP homotypic interaction motif (RHIM)-containing protein n=1 Tax=Kutzneria buriramensis TaxID=1045776 RepID=A0A3E0I6T2_9PSEU|nr:RIP homotypic interaction motif-containing protein [Kutzneria buriramensis]REH54330.1 RIP homotypic interaction motif (RHIM)-containing protein [Kutzneria buriramensis]
MFEEDTDPTTPLPVAVVRWAQLEHLTPLWDGVLAARWRGRCVLVAHPEFLRRVAAECSVATIKDMGGDGTDRRPADTVLHKVDLESTFKARGLLSDAVAENALVVDDCRGVQIGDHNVQHNEHCFNLRDVVVTMDSSIARYLARGMGGDAPASRSDNRAESVTDHHGYRVIVKNSQGVQIGDRCTQRNKFVHDVRRPTVNLGAFCTPAQMREIADKIADGKSAVRAAVSRTITAAANSDPDALKLRAVRPRDLSVSAGPARYERVDGLQAGERNKLTVKDSVNVVGVNADPFVRDFKREAAREQQGVRGPGLSL